MFRCLPLALCLATVLSAQSSPSSLTQDLRWRNIGPANMMGRIAAIDGLDSDWRTVLVGSASGGVFLSDNAGVTWRAIFDDYGSGSIGSVAFYQADPKIIWVGTGESANRNSSGWGDGIYKSTDGGESFANVGLGDTHHISELAVHPTDPDVVYAAAIGHLWGTSGSRGLWKTIDGGKTWQKLSNGLPDDGKTGATDIEMDPSNPNVLYVGMYERLRQPWHYQSGGANGGIFKTTDAGATWTKLTEGLPLGEIGQVDISIHRRDPSILVAAVETDENLPDGVPGSGVYKSMDAGATWCFLLPHAVRPFYHGQIAIDPNDPNLIYVVSRDFKVSKDGGKTFTSRWWGGGGDDHDMWISPTDSKIWYNATDQGAQRTIDGGKTITFLNNMAIGQYYAIGVDMRDPYWVIGGLQDNGIWTGPSNSREPRGILNMHNTWVGEGDGFHSQVDPTDWRTAYFVNHVGFAARLNVETREHRFITPTPETIVNYVDHVDPSCRETATRYTISPGEHWFFGYSPDRPKLPPQFRFNWSSPLVLAHANPRTVYFASNYLFRSEDRGESWRIISPDLTTNDPNKRNASESGGLTRSVTGGENHCTIVTIADSPIDPAVIWVGTDDGNLQVTRNDGVSWQNVAPNVPDVIAGAWVSRVEPSRFVKGRCYVTFDDHRRDDMSPYAFVTEDFGATWTSLTANLPDGSVYVICEDHENANLLFLGTEFAVHASLDRGHSWMRLMAGMPTVAMHDLVIHPRDGDLIAATHGRSIWILDDLSALRQWADQGSKEAHLFAPRRATKWVQIRLGRKQPNRMFRGKNPTRGALLTIHLKAASDDVRLTIADVLGNTVRTLRPTGKPGINRVVWDLRVAATAEELEDYRRQMLATADNVQERISDKEAFKELRSRIKAAKSTRQIDSLRKELVENYGHLASGQPLFGQRFGRREAAAGSYRITLTIGGKVIGTQALTVREDPLLR